MCHFAIHTLKYVFGNNGNNAKCYMWNISSVYMDMTQVLGMWIIFNLENSVNNSTSSLGEFGESH